MENINNIEKINILSFFSSIFCPAFLNHLLFNSYFSFLFFFSYYILYNLFFLYFFISFLVFFLYIFNFFGFFIIFCGFFILSYHGLPIDILIKLFYQLFHLFLQPFFI